MPRGSEGTTALTEEMNVAESPAAALISLYLCHLSKWRTLIEFHHQCALCQQPKAIVSICVCYWALRTQHIILLVYFFRIVTDDSFIVVNIHLVGNSVFNGRCHVS
jgi:hypothetical protein